MAQDFNQTLNLPETKFEMRGNLVKKEPVSILQDDRKEFRQTEVCAS